MLRIVRKNQLFLFGNINDLCDLLSDYSSKYSTLKELTEDIINCNKQS